jgi:hypothetical protein
MMHVAGSLKMSQLVNQPFCMSPMTTRSIDPASNTGTTAHMPSGTS